MTLIISYWAFSVVFCFGDYGQDRKMMNDSGFELKPSLMVAIGVILLLGWMIMPYRMGRAAAKSIRK